MMRDYKSILKNNFDLILILTLYSLLSVFLFRYYQYIINPDGLSYIGIAQKYAIGDWSNAINGYWGPLFSWLIVPFLLFNSTNLNALYMAKIISIIIGFFTLIGLNRLSYKFEIDVTIKRGILFGMIPIVLFFSFITLTPDLLIVCVLIYYLAVIFDPEYSNNWFNGVLCGFLGALAYLTKSFAFPFFLAHFVLFNLIYYFKGLNTYKKRNIFKNMFLGLFVFFVISGLWVGTISEKYEKLTIGTSGAYNQELVSPGSQGQPMYYQGLLKPPNNSAVSAWEDPSNFKMKSWSPFQSLKYFEYQLNLIWENILSVINILNFFSFLSLVIIIASILFILKSNSERRLKNKLIYLLVTMLIYSGAYCFISVERRYLWLVCVLLLFTGAYLIDICFKNKIFNTAIKNILVVLLVFSFIITPINCLIQNADLGEGAYHLGQTLGNDYGINGNIASNGEWGATLSISYYLNSKYYGITKNTTDINALQEELEDNNIGYYFVWDTNSDLQFSDYKEIFNDKIIDLKIYSRINSSQNSI
jgi:hypothetical protein